MPPHIKDKESYDDMIAYLRNERKHYARRNPQHN